MRVLEVDDKTPPCLVLSVLTSSTSAESQAKAIEVTGHLRTRTLSQVPPTSKACALTYSPSKSYGITKGAHASAQKGCTLFLPHHPLLHKDQT